VQRGVPAFVVVVIRMSNGTNLGIDQLVENESLTLFEFFGFEPGTAASACASS
jgi:hypothetical protein